MCKLLEFAAVQPTLLKKCSHQGVIKTRTSTFVIKKKLEVLIQKLTIFSTSTGVQKQSSEYDLLKLPSVI